MKIQTLLYLGAGVWGLNALVSIAQHEWYHAACEFLISYFVFILASDEDQ